MSKLERIVEAQEFRITDAEGQIRARFGMLDEKDDAVGIQISRPDGTLGASIVLTQHDCDGELTYLPSISLFDREGRLRFEVNVGYAYGDDYPGLSLLGSDQKDRITLVVPPGDFGEISFSDEEGNKRYVRLHDLKLKVIP